MYDTRNAQHDFDYELILTFPGGKPTFQISELGLIATGTDIDSTFREISRLKQDCLDKAKAADLLDTLPRPGRRRTGGMETGAAPIAASMTVRGDIPSFLIKVGIVCAVVVILLGAAGLAVRSSLHVPVGKAFWSKAEEGLHRAATGEGMSPEVQARTLADIRTLVARYKPFVDELKPLFADQQPKPGSDSK
jgi:hypothetical protein